MCGLPWWHIVLSPAKATCGCWDSVWHFDEGNTLHVTIKQHAMNERNEGGRRKEVNKHWKKRVKGKIIQCHVWCQRAFNISVLLMCCDTFFFLCSLFSANTRSKYYHWVDCIGPDFREIVLHLWGISVWSHSLKPGVCQGRAKRSCRRLNFEQVVHGVGGTQLPVSQGLVLPVGRWHLVSPRISVSSCAFVNSQSSKGWCVSVREKEITQQSCN